MIELGSSIVSSTIATVLLYPIERVRIQMQLNSIKSQSFSIPTQHQLLPEKQSQFIFQQSQLEKFFQQSLIKEKHVETLNINLNDKKSLQHNEKSLSQLKKNEKQKRNKNSINQTIIQIYQENGWTGFYTGLQSLIIGNGLAYGIYFLLYEKCKIYLGFQSSSIFDAIKCSAIAGIGGSLATNPFWVLQTKQTEQKGTIFQKANQLIKNEGGMALWKGLSSSLSLVSNPIIQFVIYEQLKKVISFNKKSKAYDLNIFLIGAFSKIIATLCTYPLTLMRTKQHVSVGKNKWTKIIKEIMKEDGPKGFFKGIQPKLLQTVLNSALILMLFEKIKKILQNYFKSKSTIR